MRVRSLCISLLLLVIVGMILLPNNSERSSGNVRTGQSFKGLTPTYSRAVGFAESAPLRAFPANAGPTVDPAFRNKTEEDEGREINDKNSDGTGVEPDANAPRQRDAALQATIPQKPAIPAPTLTFEGLSAADNIPVFGTTFAPPDPNMAVGPNDIVETTNTLVRVYDKNGNPRGPAFKLSGLFAAIGGVAANTDKGDPIVLYDRMANRWMISQFAFASSTTPPYHQVIAVSKNGDPTGAYWVYDFITPGNNFPDYPKFGAWPDAYYYTDRQFTNGGPFNSFGCIAFDRAKMLVGDPTASEIYFNLGSPLPFLSNASSGMIPTDFNGLTPPPAGAPNVFAVFTDDAFGDAADAIRLFNFHVDFAIPANSTFVERAESPLAVASFDSRNPSGRSDIEQPPPASLTADSLDSIGDRLMLRMQYVNRAGVETFTTCQTVNAGTIPAPGILPTRTQYKAGVRYYILQKNSPGGALTVPEQATFSPDTNERWMGSTAIDNAGNLAVGYSLSSTTVFPSLAYAGRLAGDPPNGLGQGEATMFTGTGAQLGSGNRWGDYTALQIDPTDDATFWYVNEYYAMSTAGGFDWHTRIGKFKFAGTTAPAQGTLSGTVTACDTGLPLADALVQVTGGPSTGFSAATMVNGTYSMNLAPGSYLVTIGDPAHNCNAIGPFAVNITNGATTTLNGCLTGIPKFALLSSAISGGNGNGTIDANECNTLNVTIQNIGCLVASGVTGSLTTSTPNVTITKPNTTFPTMNENVNGASQVGFSVSTSASFVCGTPINFTLMVTSPLGGSVSLPFTLQTCQSPPITISGSLVAGDLQQTARLGRNGIMSVCGTQKANPGTLGTGNRSYDLYSFVNGPTATCVTIATTAMCPVATNPIITVAYLTTFNPANITQNYLGDPGGSPSPSNSFSVNVPANATLLINVHEINPGTGCSGYTIMVSGLVANSAGSGPCAACMITCPANITQSNDPNQCGAVVNYPAPTTTGTCGNVSCSPSAGSFFPVGTTTVTCSTTAGPSCTFTVTVNDTQPPAISCPPNVTVTAAATCPLATSAVVTYPPPVVSDNCPGVTVVCVPPSGSILPVGTTTVTCTATDASGNTATCSFSVTVFSACLVDESNPTTVVLFNAQTGDYRFCCGGIVFTGRGVLTTRGCIGTIDELKGTRKVHIEWDTSANGRGAGTAYLTLNGSTTPKCFITDKSMAGDVCACGGSLPTGAQK